MTDHGPENNRCKVPTGWHWRYDALARIWVLLMLGVGVYALFNIHLALLLNLVYSALFLATGITNVLNPPIHSMPALMSHGQSVIKDKKTAPSSGSDDENEPSRNTSHDGCHVVFIAHYKEERWIIHRLLDSIAASANRASWPVHVVIAAEATSNLSQDQTWTIKKAESLAGLHIFFHTLADGERAGPGSNLRNAVNAMLAKDKVIPFLGSHDHCMVTKMDGNSCMAENFFALLEKEWCQTGCDRHVTFQPITQEIDYRFAEFNATSLMARSGNTVRLLDTTGTHVLPGSNYHCCYCIPLETILAAGHWDPWLIQEENLMSVRVQLGSDDGEPVKIRLLRAIVYNAPALSVRDMHLQGTRWARHGLYVLGYLLGNLHKLNLWKQGSYLVFAVIYMGNAPIFLMQSLTGVGILLNRHEANPIWRDVALFSIATMNAVFCILVGVIMSEHWGKRRTVPLVMCSAIIFSIGLVHRLAVFGVASLLVLFGGEESRLSFTTTPTLKNESKEGDQRQQSPELEIVHSV